MQDVFHQQYRKKTRLLSAPEDRFQFRIPNKNMVSKPALFILFFVYVVFWQRQLHKNQGKYVWFSSPQRLATFNDSYLPLWIYLFSHHGSMGNMYKVGGSLPGINRVIHPDSVLCLLLGRFCQIWDKKKWAFWGRTLGKLAIHSNFPSLDVLPTFFIWKYPMAILSKLVIWKRLSILGELHSSSISKDPRS